LLTFSLRCYVVSLVGDLTRLSKMIKYVNNAYLTAKISLINVIANICERIGDISIGLIAKGIGLGDKISTKFLEAGPIWGFLSP